MFKVADRVCPVVFAGTVKYTKPDPAPEAPAWIVAKPWLDAVQSQPEGALTSNVNDCAPL
jgi:hypothetical protein